MHTHCRVVVLNKMKHLDKRSFREAQEELGITIQEDDLEFVHTFYRKGSDHELVACIFKCVKWQGDLINKEPEKHD